MRHLSKVCDAADWFDPELLQVIQEELQEPARFHRKQWEFAIIFLALKKYGMIDPAKVGLSLGGGNERVLYSIARHIRHLTVTDLYDQNTDWDCARTADPDIFIRQSKPFPTDDHKIKALRMDMRHLDFDDASFDFCYSSCAVEHIGSFADFLQHLNEVYRVLKTDGIYVFTTEFHFGEETIEDQNNYIFSGNYLKRLISESNLSVALDPCLTITNHRANIPLPSNINNLCYSEESLHEQISLDTMPHILLLRGKHPFTSISIILKKSQSKNAINFDAGELQETKNFLQQGITSYRETLYKNTCSLNPFSGMGKSPFFADHKEFFTQDQDQVIEDDTVFHSDYFWLGNGKRNFQILLVTSLSEPFKNCVLQLRLHRLETLNSKNVECIHEQAVDLSGNGSQIVDFQVVTDDQYSYAVLGKLVEGNCLIHHLKILSNTSPLFQEVFLKDSNQNKAVSFKNL